MAITAKTILTNPAAAALAVVSTLGMGAAFILLNSTPKCQESYSMIKIAQSSPCDTVRRSNGFDRAKWSEYDWFRYAQCFSNRNDSRRTIEVVTQGLKYHPRSEALFNVKGYHLIKTQKYSQAVETLQLGLRRVGRPTSGTIYNNLAWAGLWSPRDMTIKEARGLYTRALRIEPKVCETLHTGLMVEYAAAKRSTGFERVSALKRFGALNDRYTPCLKRYKNGSWHTITEVASAVAAADDINQMTGMQSFVAMDKSLGKRVVHTARRHYRSASVDAICRDAMPFANHHHTCVKSLQKHLRTR